MPLPDQSENGIDRLFRIWPKIVKLQYPQDPDTFKANATPKAVRAFWDEAETGRFWLGYPNNPDHVALACIVQAARHMCGMDPNGALRLLHAAIEEIETHDSSSLTEKELHA